MSGILPLIDERDSVKQSMQELTLKKARLSDTSLSVRVDICYRLIEQQTLKLKEMNSILVNLLQSKDKKKEQNLMVVEDNKNEK